MKLFQRLKEFVSNGFVLYNSKLAALLKVQVLVVLGFVFCEAKQSMSAANKAVIGRLQMAEVAIASFILMHVVIAMLGIAASMQLLIVTAVLSILMYNIMYGLSALFSYLRQPKGKRTYTTYSSVYYLDMVDHANDVSRRHPFSHWLYVVIAYNPGTKLKKRGFYEAVAVTKDAKEAKDYGKV